MIIPPGATSVSVDVFFADDTGAAVTGKVAADFPACKWSGGTNTADTTITLSDLSLITTAHPNDNTAGGVKEREGGWYRLDLPNNMLTSAGRKRLTFAETTNKRILADPIDVQYTQTDVRQLLGTAWLSPGTAGTPDVNVKLWNALATVALPLVPTVAGRTLDVSAGGEAGLDWANVGSPTTSLALTGTTIAVTQKVDVDTIKTNPVVNGGTVTFPTGATLASTTNITAGTITTVTTVTNQLTAAAIATGVWQDTTAGDFTTALSVGKSLMNGVALGTGLAVARCTLTDTLTTYTGNTVQTGDSFARIGLAGVGLTNVVLPSGGLANVTAWSVAITGNVTGNLSGSVGSVTGLTAADLGAVRAKTDQLTFTVSGSVDASAGGTAFVHSAGKLWVLDGSGNAIATAVQNADALLGRNVAGGSSTGRTVSQAFFAIRNKVAISGGTMTVMSTDDVTPSWTAAVTSDATADPIVTVDPA